MRAVEKIATCQISFLTIGTGEYSKDIKHVLEQIKGSGLEYDIGAMSTVVTGPGQDILKLIGNIYDSVKDTSSFVMDIRLSNVCGCS